LPIAVLTGAVRRASKRSLRVIVQRRLTAIFHQLEKKIPLVASMGNMPYLTGNEMSMGSGHTAILGLWVFCQVCRVSGRNDFPEDKEGFYLTIMVASIPIG
jgi:hypothetical protein